MSRHAMMMQDYYCAVEAWKAAAEQATAMYATELTQYKEQNPPPQFRDWLIQWRNQ